MLFCSATGYVDQVIQMPNVQFRNYVEEITEVGLVR